MRARLGRHAADLQEESFGNSMVSLTAPLIARSSKSLRTARRTGRKATPGHLCAGPWRVDRHLAHAMDIACA